MLGTVLRVRARVCAHACVRVHMSCPFPASLPTVSPNVTLFTTHKHIHFNYFVYTYQVFYLRKSNCALQITVKKPVVIILIVCEDGTE